MVHFVVPSIARGKMGHSVFSLFVLQSTKLLLIYVIYSFQPKGPFYYRVKKKL